MAIWLDLSRPIVEGASVYPGDPLFDARPFAEHATDGFRGTRLTVGTHLGTHLDAPFHYFVDGETLDVFPLDFFFGAACVVDLRTLVGVGSARFEARASGRPATIGVDELAPFESLFESVPFIFLRSGWASRYGRDDFYTDFPSLSPETCDWLADFPKLRILGLETPSLVAFPTDQSDVQEKDDAKSNASVPFDSELRELLPSPPPLLTPPLSMPSSTIDAEERRANEEPLNELELCADAECHRILLGRQPPILILEGLVGLEQTPCFTLDDADSTGRVPFDATRAFDVACFPAPFVGLDGCPVRVAARCERSVRE